MYEIKKKLLLITIICYGVFVLLFSCWGLTTIDKSGKRDLSAQRIRFYECVDWKINKQGTWSKYYIGSDPTPIPPILHSR